MASRDKKSSEEKTHYADIAAGVFPFQLSDSEHESHYLTWVRNDSNYMAVRSFLNYFRSIGVLVRGIVLNFLIFLPTAAQLGAVG